MEKNLFIMVLVLLYSAYTSAEYSYKTRYSIEDGLSQNVVFDIIQDQEGFLWFATEDGLNRFDGYDFKIYRSHSDEIHSISDNKILSLYEDRFGYIWIGTKYGGLNRLDKKTEVFTKFVHHPGDTSGISSNQYITSIVEEDNGRLWIGTDNGLNSFDRESGIFINHSSKNETLFRNIVLFIWCLKFDTQGNLWIGSSRGLYRLNPKNGHVNKFSHDPDNQNSLSHNIIRALCLDGDSALWIGTDNGINYMNLKTEEIKRFNQDRAQGLSNHSIREIYKDNQGRLWIGTIKGLNWYDEQTEQFHHFSFGLPLNESYDNLFVYKLFQDNRDNVWLATIGDGIINLRIENNQFHFIQYSPKDTSGLSDVDLLTIFEDHLGEIWIGTYRGGLNEYHSETGKFLYHKREEGNSQGINANGINAITEDGVGNIWLGTFGGGINCYVRSEKKFIHYTAQDTLHDRRLLSNQVYCLYIDSDSCLWAGVAGGINCLDLKTKKVKAFSYDLVENIWSSQVVTSIAEDSNGILWTGTNGGGLVKLDKKSGNRRRYANLDNDINSLSNNRINTVYIDTKGNIWIGTLGGGLNRFDPVGLSFSRYSTNDGLSNNDIFSIIEKDGYLWLSTNKGISRFDMANETFRNYDLSDGLKTYHIDGKSYLSKTGKILFSGKNGFYFFNPDSLVDNPHIPPLVITKFKVFDREVRLDTNVNYISRIEISHDENFFSLEFAALDFTDPGKNKYAYKLEGFDENWIYCGSRRYVSYTNLKGNDYIFHVKGTNNDGLWNEKGKSIKFTIHPPFWEEWWFRLLIIFMIGGVIYLFLRLRIKQIYAIESLKNQISADLHDNIGSSLTEISILSEITRNLICGDREALNQNLKKISEISRYLVSSMSDTVWLINPKKDSLYELVLRLKDTYVELLTHYNIKFKTENLVSLSRIQLPMDYRQNLYLIFKEAINNSIKYSGCTEIELKAMVRGGNLSMSVFDNGKGFDTLQKSSGNGLENMKERALKIKGHLKIESNGEYGTKIQFAGKIEKSKEEKWLI